MRNYGSIQFIGWSARLAGLPAVLLLTVAASGQDISQEAAVALGQLQQAPPTPRTAGMPDAFVEGANIYDLGPLTAEQIADADRQFADFYADQEVTPPRLGLSRSPAFPLSLGAGVARRITQGTETLWTLAIRSPGAFGLRLRFSDFDVGQGTVLVYAYEGSDLVVRGPFTDRGFNGDGEFWTESLPGDIAYIEVSGVEKPQLEVAEIGHFDRDPAGDLNSPLEGVSQPCHLDVMCYGNPPVHPLARDAVARLVFQVSPGGGFGGCTGTILNDLDPETTVPYMLTAYHCFHTQFSAGTLEAVYLWQRASCGGTLPNFSTLPRSNGSQLLESNPTTPGNDMTFVRVRGNLPGGVTLAGWTTGGLPAQVVGIHHPSGSWKRVDFGHQATDGPINCSGLPTSEYHYIAVDSGITEPGSSGSGIFNYNAQILGQLFGSCHYSPPNPCVQRDQWRDVYGQFAITYPFVRRWMEIGGTIHVNGSYIGIEEGTPARPFRAATSANNLINAQNWDGSHIKIQAGTYFGPMTITHATQLIAVGGPVTLR